MLNKQRFCIQDLVGREFGSVYKVNSKTKCLDYVENLDDLFDFKNSLADLIEEEGKRDNRSIKDDNRSQKLTRTDIVRAKEDGLTAKQIIETLVENSSTFNQKTIYSQEKYLKKKQEKYSNYIRIYKPNTTLLCDMWFNQGAHKSGQIRFDSLAHMLNLCNLRSGCKYIVVDNYFGIVTAAVLERLIGDGSVFDRLPGDSSTNSTESKTAESKTDPDAITDVGKCVQILVEQGPNNTWRDAIYALNYKEHQLSQCLFNAQIHKTMRILKGESVEDIVNDREATSPSDQGYKMEAKNGPDETKAEANCDKMEMKNDSDEELKNESKCDQLEMKGDPDETKSESKVDELEDEFRRNKRLKSEGKMLRKKKRTTEERTALELLSKKNFDGLIVIGRNFDLGEIAGHLLNFLAPSAQIVIFSDHLQALTDCYSEIKNRTCNSKLSEIWMRNYQILPMRTRPEMDMFGRSGYILHGVKLLESDV